MATVTVQHTHNMRTHECTLHHSYRCLEYEELQVVVEGTQELLYMNQGIGIEDVTLICPSAKFQNNSQLQNFNFSDMT